MLYNPGDIINTGPTGGETVNFIRQLAYDYWIGPFPVIAWAGLLTYATFLTAAALAALRRWVKPLRRIPLKVHRRVAYAGLLLATIHLLFALSIYV
jgi:hypothetical protein